MPVGSSNAYDLAGRALAHVSGFALEKRDIDVSIAPPIVQAAFGLTVLFLALGLALLPIAIFALVRARGYRAPYFILAVSVFLYFLQHLLSTAYYLLTFSDDAEPIDYVLLSNVAALWMIWADVFLFLALLMILWNRAASLASAHPHEKPSIIKKLIDCILIGLMFLWVLVYVSVVAAANADRFNGRITSLEQRDRAKAAYGVRHVSDVFNVFILVDIILSAIMLRSRMAKYQARDQPTNTVAFGAWPILVLHFIFRIYASAQASADLFSNRLNRNTVDRNRIISLISVIEGSIFIAAIYIILFVVGFKRAAWNTFGDKPIGGAPKTQWAQPQQWQQQQQQPGIIYQQQPYPVQVQYQPQQMFQQQPGVVYQQWTPQTGTATPPPPTTTTPASAAPNMPQV